MEVEKPGYYAVIPASVRYSKEISNGAKLLYAEITCLSNQHGYCWASNVYFSKIYEVSTDTVSRWIGELARAGFILTIVDNAAGNSRKIWLSETHGIGKKQDTLSAKMPIGYPQKSVDPIRKNADIIEKENSKKNKTTEGKIDVAVFDPSINALIVDSIPVEEKEKTPPDSAPPPNKEKESPSESSPRRYDAFDIDVDAARLKEDQLCRDRFGKDLRIGLEKATIEFQAYVDRFVENQKSETFNYPNTKEFRRHFFNWIPKVYGIRLPGNQAQVRNGQGQSQENITSKMRQL